MGSEFLSRSYFDPQGQFRAETVHRFLEPSRECFRRTEPAPEATKPEARKCLACGGSWTGRVPLVRTDKGYAFAHCQRCSGTGEEPESGES